MLFLFVDRDATVFGLSYVSQNYYTTLKNEFTIDDVDTISLTTNNYDVEIYASDNKQIKMRVDCHTEGYIYGNNKTYITESLEDSVLNLKVNEVKGMTMDYNSVVRIYIPKKSGKKLNLEIINNSSSVKVMESGVKINTLTYKTKTGDFDLDKGEILSNMDISLGHATFTIGKNVDLNKNNVTLKISNGHFYSLSNDTLGKVELVGNKRADIRINKCNEFINSTNSKVGVLYIG